MASTKAQMIEQRKRRWERRLAAGLCVDCGKRKIAKSSKRCCAVCLRQRKQYASTPAVRGQARDTRVAWYHRLRTQVIDHYTAGTRTCACPGCNVSGLPFLTIDHIAEDGAAHRKTVKAGVKLFRWLITNHFPPGFQILCWNCNAAKHYYGNGQCPCHGAPHSASTLAARPMPNSCKLSSTEPV